MFIFIGVMLFVFDGFNIGFEFVVFVLMVMNVLICNNLEFNWYDECCGFFLCGFGCFVEGKFFYDVGVNFKVFGLCFEVDFFDDNKGCFFVVCLFGEMMFFNCDVMICGSVLFMVVVGVVLFIVCVNVVGFLLV